nr:transposase [Thermaerobacter marianensis]
MALLEFLRKYRKYTASLSAIPCAKACAGSCRSSTQPDAATARQRVQQVADDVGTRDPRVAALLHEAEDDVLAYMAFPAEHWRRTHSIP